MAAFRVLSFHVHEILAYASYFDLTKFKHFTFYLKFVKFHVIPTSNSTENMPIGTAGGRQAPAPLAATMGTTAARPLSRGTRPRAVDKGWFYVNNSKIINISDVQQLFWKAALILHTSGYFLLRFQTK